MQPSQRLMFRNGGLFHNWEAHMAGSLGRRDFLKASAALAGAAAGGGFSCLEIASAAAIDVPAVDKLTVRVLVDGAFDSFSCPQKVNGVTVEVGRSSDFRRPFHAQWGL